MVGRSGANGIVAMGSTAWPSSTLSHVVMVAMGNRGSGRCLMPGSSGWATGNFGGPIVCIKYVYNLSLGLNR
jgi:hypothetical protein